VSVPEQAPYDGVPAIDGGKKRHPTFVALVGFYVGMLLMILIPSGFAAVVTQLASPDDLMSYAPFGLLPFAIPLLLLISRETRRFGRYMLLGMVSTALVIGIVGGGVLYVLIHTS